MTGQDREEEEEEEEEEDVGHAPIPYSFRCGDKSKSIEPASSNSKGITNERASYA